MRIRSVHPNLCTDELMAEVSAELERTFVRLWLHCDDEGRCVDNARLIKAAVYPLLDSMTPARVDQDLDRLAELNLIIRYEAGGKRYLAVRSWGEYQHPQKPRPSQYPEPPVVVAAESRTSTRTIPEDDASGEGEGEGVGDGIPLSTSPTPVETVFDAWREATGHHKAVLDSKRRKRITYALRYYPTADLVDAVRGWRHSPHHRGENDRHTVYNDLDLLLRDSAHIENFRDLERGDTRSVVHQLPRGSPMAQTVDIAGRMARGEL